MTARLHRPQFTTERERADDSLGNNPCEDWIHSAVITRSLMQRHFRDDTAFSISQRM